MKDIIISMSDVMNDLTFTVRVKQNNLWAVRQWLAIQVFKLGARILGCGFVFEMEGKDAR